MDENMTELSNREKEKLTDIVNGMSDAEKSLVSELLPINLILRRLGIEIEEKKNLERKVECLRGCKCHDE